MTQLESVDALEIPYTTQRSREILAMIADILRNTDGTQTKTIEVSFEQDYPPRPVTIKITF